MKRFQGEDINCLELRGNLMAVLGLEASSNSQPRGIYLFIYLFIYCCGLQQLDVRSHFPDQVLRD